MTRGMAMLLTLLVLAAALFAGWSSTRQVDYFPARLDKVHSECRFYDGSVERQIVQDEYDREWFEGELAGFREPSLYHRPRGSLRAVRFLWLRSFDDLMVVRIDDLADGGKQLTAKRRPGGAGFTEDGAVGRSVERVRRLSAPETAGFEAVFQEAAPFSHRDAGCRCCLDGSQWIVEISDPQHGYRYRRYQSPEAGIEYQLGSAMLALTGWDLSPTY